MANGIGVSVSKRSRGGKAVWVVRWRESVEQDGQRTWRSRQRMVTSEQAAVELRARILRTIDVGEVFAEEVTVVADTTSFDAIGVAWLKRKEARAAAASTLKRYARSLQKFADVVRFLRNIPGSRAIPASELCDALLDEVANELRAPSAGRVTTSVRELRNGVLQERSRAATPASEGEIYATLQRALEAWTLGAQRFEGVPQPPSEVPVPPPLYEAGPAPSLAHCDAVLRQLARDRRSRIALAAAVVMRWTGLRVSQVQALGWEHLDRDALTIQLPAEAGKSRREKSRSRVIPVSAHLVEDLGRLGEVWEPDPLWLVPRRLDRTAGPKAGSSPSGTIRRAWERATKEDGVPEGGWNPQDRQQARPDHAFRAALQAHLDTERVRESTIDGLVGHAPKSTRRRHYAAVGQAELREAVDQLPPVEWLDAWVRLNRGR